MGRRIVVTNDKGGVGKTVTVHHLAVGLVLRGYRVLAIDLDPQGDLTEALAGSKPPASAPTVASFLLGKNTFDEVRVNLPRYEALSLLPANTDLAEASLVLATRAGGQTTLRRALGTLNAETYDYCLIDTGKGLDLLVINALAAADEVIIALTPGQQELRAALRMFDHVAKVREHVLLGADHPCLVGFVVSYADRYTITRDTLAALAEQQIPVLARIPKNDDVKKAISRALTTFEFAPQSRAAVAFGRLLEELLHEKR